MINEYVKAMTGSISSYSFNDPHHGQLYSVAIVPLCIMHRTYLHFHQPHRIVIPVLTSGHHLLHQPTVGNRGCLFLNKLSWRSLNASYGSDRKHVQ